MTTDKKPNPHRGSSLDDLFRADGVLEQVQAAAIKTVIAWQITRELETQTLNNATKTTRAQAFRVQFNRPFDPAFGLI